MIVSLPSGRTIDAGKQRHAAGPPPGGTEPLSYQWRRNSTNVLSDGGNLSGTTNATLMLNQVLGGDTAN